MLKSDVCNEESMKGMEAMLSSLTKLIGEDDGKDDEDFTPEAMNEMLKGMGLAMPSPAPSKSESQDKPTPQKKTFL